MKIKSSIIDFLSLNLTDFINFKKKGKRNIIKTFITDFFILFLSFILADFINQTKNDLITFAIACPIVFFVNAIIKIIKNKKRTAVKKD